VLANCVIDRRVWQGLSFGMGVERITRLKDGIPDLRPFYEADIRWLRHYGADPLSPPSLVDGV
jgi:phenylalanyl-tRNA synthetase alpha chain